VLFSFRVAVICQSEIAVFLDTEATLTRMLSWYGGSEWGLPLVLRDDSKLIGAHPTDRRALDLNLEDPSGAKIVFIFCVDDCTPFPVVY
jgi:hypothetical protein